MSCLEMLYEICGTVGRGENIQTDPKTRVCKMEEAEIRSLMRGGRLIWLVANWGAPKDTYRHTSSNGIDSWKESLLSPQRRLHSSHLENSRALWRKYVAWRSHSLLFDLLSIILIETTHFHLWRYLWQRRHHLPPNSDANPRRLDVPVCLCLDWLD